ncbi:hypothetical protein THRCLA_22207, partial [Thraustotheca clavata]
MGNAVVLIIGIALVTALQRNSFSSQQLQEELVLRNVNPFGVVFNDVSQKTADNNGAYCATGEFGALEHWERVVQENQVFYYCKDRDSSQWEPPCRWFEADRHSDPIDEDMTRIFPLSYEPLEGYEEIEMAENAEIADTASEEMDPTGFISMQTNEELEHVHLTPLFQFKGTLDDIRPIANRKQLQEIPNEYRDAARKNFTASDIEVMYANMLRNVLIAEANIEKNLQENYHILKLYSVEDVNINQRDIFATAWSDLGGLAFARGNATLAINCFRRSLFWQQEFSASYLKIAHALASLKLYDESCQVLQRLSVTDRSQGSTTTTLFSWVPDLATQFPHCSQLISQWTPETKDFVIRY